MNPPKFSYQFSKHFILETIRCKNYISHWKKKLLKNAEKFSNEALQTWQLNRYSNRVLFSILLYMNGLQSKTVAARNAPVVSLQFSVFWTINVCWQFSRKKGWCSTALVQLWSLSQLAKSYHDYNSHYNTFWLKVIKWKKEKFSSHWKQMICVFYKDRQKLSQESLWRTQIT